MGICYPHLSLEERRKIAKWREAKMPVPEITDRLGRAASTIYRELKRNAYQDSELPNLNGCPSSYEMGHQSGLSPGGSGSFM